jgi:hypothetical protein
MPQNGVRVIPIPDKMLEGKVAPATVTGNNYSCTLSRYAVLRGSQAMTSIPLFIKQAVVGGWRPEGHEAMLMGFSPRTLRSTC